MTTGYPPLPATIAVELRTLWGQARRVNGATPPGHPDRLASETLSARLYTLNTQGWGARRLGAALRVTPRAVLARLERHGYRTPSPSSAHEMYQDTPPSSVGCAARTRTY